MKTFDIENFINYNKHIKKRTGGLKNEKESFKYHALMRPEPLILSGQ